jgi:hypothetical protein
MPAGKNYHPTGESLSWGLLAAPITPETDGRAGSTDRQPQQAEEGASASCFPLFPLQTPALVRVGERTGVRAALQQGWPSR